jgi:uncharacterized protein
MPRYGDRPAVFHPGELEAQARSDETVAAQRLGPVVRPFLVPAGTELIESARLAAATTLDPDGAPTLSLLTTEAGGFGTVGHSGLTIPRAALVPEDVLFANVKGDRRIGLVFLDPSTRGRFRVNGEVVNFRTDPLEVTIVEAFPNCKKYLVRQELTANGRAPGESGEARGRGIAPAHAALLREASLIFVGTANPQGHFDAATRSGDPGFVREIAPGHFEIPDLPGNAMYQSIGNLLLEPRASIGLLAGSEFVVLTGSATTHWEEAAERQGGTGRFWRFRPEHWRRVPLSLPVRLTGYERSAHTPVLDGREPVL